VPSQSSVCQSPDQSDSTLPLTVSPVIFAFVFGGDFSAVAVADDFEGDFVAGNFAFQDLGFVFVANGDASQFIAILF